MRSHILFGCTVLFAAVLLQAPGAARAATLHIECEDFTASYNVYPEDPQGIGGVLYGLDWPGEWTRYNLAALAPGRYSVVVKCWGDYNTQTYVRLTLSQAPANAQLVDVTYTGHGACGT
jgi:hypothetical protein